MTLTSAMAEAYASAKADAEIFETVELDHVTFAEPVRVVTGVEEDMMLPVNPGGPPVLFRACQVSVTLPGVTEDGPTPAKLRLDNVSALLLPYLREAVRSDQPVTATYRAYTSEDLAQPGDVYDDLELWEVDLDPLSATGTLRFRELELQAFPLATYSQALYPALQNV